MAIRVDAVLGADASGYVAGMGQAQAAAQRFAQTASASARTAGAGFSELTTTVKNIEGAIGKMRSRLTQGFAAIGAGMVIPSIFNAAKGALIDFNQQLDQSRIAFTTFMGSAEKANAMLLELQTFAAKTPFNFKDLLGTTQQMIAMGTAAEDLIPRLTAIGDAAAALGGSPEVMRRIQRALGQIQAKGRVQAEELMQLAEVGIPAYEYIANVLGVTIPQSLKMMERGQVSAATAITGLLDGMGADFGGMMQKHSQTMMGALSTVQDYVSITIANMSRPLFEAVRGLFVSLGNFLSTNDMKKRAEDFATSVRNAFTSAGQAAKQIWDQIRPTMESVYNTAISLGRLIGNGWKSAQPAIKAAIAAVVGVAKVVKPVIDAIGELAKRFKDSKVAGMAVATALITKFTPLGGMIKKISEEIVKLTSTKATGDVFKVFGEGQKAMGAGAQQTQQAADAMKKATVTMQGGLAVVGTEAINTNTKLSFFAASQQVITKMAGSAWVSFRATFSAVMLSLKASLISFAATIPLLLAITAITTALSGLGKKNREAKARVKELSDELKGQTDALWANEEAIRANAKAGVDGGQILSDALTGVGDDGNKLKMAFGEIGKAFDVQTFLQVGADFEEFAYKVLRAKGLTETAAKSMALNINTTDNNDLSASWDSLTEAQKRAVDALEEIQDQYEKTDVSKVIADNEAYLVSQGRVRGSTKQLALFLAEQTDGYANLSPAIQETIYYDKLLEAALYEEVTALNEAALARADYEAMAGDSVLATKDLITQYNELVKSQTDGQLSFEEFKSGVFAASNATKSWTRSLKEGQDEIDSLLEGLKDGGKDFEGLQSAVMGLDDQLQSVFYEGQQLGKSLPEIQGRMQELASSFVQGAVDAGYTDEQVRTLLSALQTLGMLDAIGITIYTDLSAAQADLNNLLSALGNIVAIGAPVGGSLDGLLSKIRQAQQAVDALGKTRPKRSGGGGGGSKEEEDPFAWVEGWVSSIADVANKFIASDFINPLTTSTSAQIKDAFTTVFNSLTELGIDKIPAFKAMVDAIKNQFMQLADLADVRDVLTYNLNAAVDALGALQQRFDQVAEAAGRFDSSITGSTAPVTTLLDQALQAQDRYGELLRNSDQLRQQQATLAQDVAKSVFQPLSSGNQVGQAQKMLRDAISFRDNLVALYERGFTPDIIQQVAQAGVTNGNKIARSLLSMSGVDFEQFMALRSEIAAVGAEAGAIAGTIVFGADIADADQAVSEQHALVRQLFTDALAEARTNLDAQTQTVNLLRQALDSVTAQIADLVEAIRVDLYDAFGNLLAGLPNGFSQLNPLTSNATPTNTEITINVSGSVISEGQLIEKVRQGLLSAQRSGRTVVI